MSIIASNKTTTVVVNCTEPGTAAPVVSDTRVVDVITAGPQGKQGMQGPPGPAGTSHANTDDLPEGAANRYYTDQRVDDRIAAAGGTPGGLATLDPATGDVPYDQLPADIVASPGRLDSAEERLGGLSLLTRPHYPLLSSLTAANAGGDADLLARMRRGLLDVRLYGIPDTTSYYIERLRRNFSGNWHIVIKRASDNVTVLQFFGPLTEPADPSVAMAVPLTSMTSTPPFNDSIGTVYIRWSEFVAGATNTGLTATLSPAVTKRDIASPLNAMPVTAARLNNVILPMTAGQSASVDEAARKFNWPQINIVDGKANAAGRFRLDAGSVTFDAANQVAWLDLIEAASYGVGLIPASAVKKAVYGITTSSYRALPHQFPLAWSAGAGHVDVNPLFRLPAQAPAGWYTGDTVVHADQANNVVSVYMRANGKQGTNTYIRYRLFHHVAADADVWTIAGIYESQRTGPESFTDVKRLVIEQTELLCAIQEQGAADLMGGLAHGDEVVSVPPVLLVDGAEVSLTSGAATWRQCETVTFIQKSTMFRVGSALATPLAERGVVLTFKDGEMFADQRIKHLANYTIQSAYFAMLAPHRYETFVNGVSENTSSSQISGKYAHNGSYTTNDVSTRQATQDWVADYARLSPPVTRVKMWGTYGVECEMELLDVSDPILSDLFYINRTSYAYNKAYVGFIGSVSGNSTVTPATVWTAKTRWAFRSKN